MFINPEFVLTLLQLSQCKVVWEGFLADLRAQSPDVCVTIAYGSFLPWEFDAVPRGEGWEEIVTSFVHMVVGKPRGDDPGVTGGFGDPRVNLNIGDGVIELQTPDIYSLGLLV